jgi:hypothetical protein
MRTGDTERRTGMTCAKITGCEMGSQGQDEKRNKTEVNQSGQSMSKDRF